MVIQQVDLFTESIRRHGLTAKGSARQQDHHHIRHYVEYSITCSTPVSSSNTSLFITCNNSVMTRNAFLCRKSWASTQNNLGRIIQHVYREVITTFRTVYRGPQSSCPYLPFEDGGYRHHIFYSTSFWPEIWVRCGRVCSPRHRRGGTAVGGACLVRRRCPGSQRMLGCCSSASPLTL